VTSSGIAYYPYEELVGNEPWCKTDVVPKVLLLAYFPHPEELKVGL
jgi:hypothetical protein